MDKSLCAFLQAVTCEHLMKGSNCHVTADPHGTNPDLLQWPSLTCEHCNNLTEMLQTQFPCHMVWGLNTFLNVEI